jgi:hypothetical protein
LVDNLVVWQGIYLVEVTNAYIGTSGATALFLRGWIACASAPGIRDRLPTRSGAATVMIVDARRGMHKSERWCTWRASVQSHGPVGTRRSDAKAILSYDIDVEMDGIELVRRLHSLPVEHVSMVAMMVVNDRKALSRLKEYH